MQRLTVPYSQSQIVSGLNSVYEDLPMSKKKAAGLRVLFFVFVLKGSQSQKHQRTQVCLSVQGPPFFSSHVALSCGHHPTSKKTSRCDFCLNTSQ
mmetsp:Transcript_20077/g.33461  ORF Transcript_20077/g.33461 Transcript_20077/m.33461 type:complete len:95 (-) Transcript_20077:506-790(-)